MRNCTILIFFFLSLSCTPEMTDGATGELAKELTILEDLVYTNPAKALQIIDSVKTSSLYINDNEHAGEKYYGAYLNLCEAIASEQKNGTYQNDSAMAVSLDWFRKKSDQYNICRSLLYRSIALFHINRFDSTAYDAILESQNLYIKTGEKDTRLGAKIHLYLGKQYRANSNEELARLSLGKSLEKATLAGDKNTAYSARIELFRLDLATKRYSQALNNISVFADETELPPFIEYNLNMAMYYYYSAKKESKIAIEFLKKILELKQTEPPLSINYPLIYYMLSLQYNRLGQQDSTDYYTKASVTAIKDTSRSDSHFYYRSLADLYQKQGNFKEAASLYKKAHFSYMLAHTRISKKKLLELESKFNFAGQEKIIQELKSRDHFLINVILILLATIVIGFFYFTINLSRLEKRSAKIKEQSKRQKNESDKNWLLSQLFIQASGILPQFMDNVFSEAGRVRKISGETFENLNKIIDNAGNASRSSLPEITSSARFNDAFGNLPFIGELTDFEKLVYVLGEEGFSISEIANFLNSSYSSIRTIKGKIARKINKSEEEIGVDF